MPRTRKQVSFDLDTKALKEYYPYNSWNHAYEDIKRHIKRNGFEWQQGSVYVSTQPMSHFHLKSIIEDLLDSNIWLNKCMRDCRETNIGRENSLNYLFDKEIILNKYDSE